ncbi:hypothetical protein QAD02_015798 [Eretmocerus hayati]|uniref:Uncharacterized protein n=1 Tax=Eretmocerus hayati TaxID=131215 RepID=A0ACC2PAI0_9HYME|nr:hypothetical protein QAD02_015798 [Eretmocerus hayati]
MKKECSMAPYRPESSAREAIATQPAWKYLHLPIISSLAIRAFQRTMASLPNPIRSHQDDFVHLGSSHGAVTTWISYENALGESSRSTELASMPTPRLQTEVTEITHKLPIDLRKCEKVPTPVKLDEGGPWSNNGPRKRCGLTPASPHGAVKRKKLELASSTCENAPTPVNSESSHRPVSSFSDSFEHEVRTNRVTGMCALPKRTIDQGIKGPENHAAGSVVTNRRPAIHRPVKMPINDSSPKRITRRPGRWLPGAPGGWWPEDTAAAASSDEEWILQPPPQKKRRVTLDEASTEMCAVSSTSNISGLDKPWPQPLSRPHSPQTLPRKSPKLPHGHESLINDYSSDSSSSTWSTKAMASSDDDQTTPQGVLPTSSSAYSSDEEYPSHPSCSMQRQQEKEEAEAATPGPSRASVPSPPPAPLRHLRRTRAERAARNASWQHPVNRPPPQCEVGNLDTSSDDDDLQVPGVLRSANNASINMPINLALYDHLSGAFRLDQSPANAKPFLKYAKKLAFRKKEAIRVKNYRDDKKRRTQEAARQQEQQSRRLVSKLEEVIDSMGMETVPALEPGAAAPIDSSRAPADVSVVAGSSTESAHTALQLIEHQARPRRLSSDFSFLNLALSPLRGSDVGVMDISFDDILLALPAMPSEHVVQPSVLQSEVALPEASMGYDMPSLNTLVPATPASPSADEVSDLVSSPSATRSYRSVSSPLQPCAEDATGQYVLEALHQPADGAPMRFRIRRAPQVQQPSIDNDGEDDATSMQML